MKRPGARGLTLIEVLVIIVLLFILAAILFPVFAATGCKPSCHSRLERLGSACLMYAQDYDDTLPWNPDPGGLPAGSTGAASRASNCAPQPDTSFVALLLPYAKTPWVFRCPADDGYGLVQHLGYTNSLAKVARESGDDPAWINRIGYGFNEVLIASPCRPRTLASLKHDPSEVALFSDAEQPWASTTNTWAHIEGEWGRYWAWDPRVGRRHAWGQVFVYADGHARVGRPVLRGVGTDQSERAAGHGYFPDAKLE